MDFMFLGWIRYCRYSKIPFKIILFKGNDKYRRIKMPPNINSENSKALSWYDTFVTFVAISKICLRITTKPKGVPTYYSTKFSKILHENEENCTEKGGIQNCTRVYVVAPELVCFCFCICICICFLFPPNVYSALLNVTFFTHI